MFRRQTGRKTAHRRCKQDKRNANQGRDHRQKTSAALRQGRERRARTVIVPPRVGTAVGETVSTDGATRQQKHKAEGQKGIRR